MMRLLLSIFLASPPLWAAPESVVRYQINESVGMPKGPFPRWKESDILIRNFFDSALSP